MPVYTLAVDIYKYKDENGAWVFGDKEPPVESEKLNINVTEKKDIAPKLFIETTNEGEVLNIVNPFYVSVEIVVKSRLFEKGRLHAVIEENSTTTLYEAPYKSGVGISDAQLYWLLGDPGAKHDGTVYHVPSASKTQHKITQSFKGRFSHIAEPSFYAVDLDMAIGTYITAARAGVVIYVKDNYYYSGTKEYFADKANVVQVLHEDGTYATYAHILGGTALVKPGDLVQTGAKLARSGSSGYSTGPHLHFVVQKNGGMKTISVPFEFVSKRGIAFTPEAGKYIGGK
ncbi:MAG: M23 family metallopeptidase [Gammaproteobacteria bacterium]|nr:M23 family metallopeptidase [Gammaproteobacteria bacterium]